MDETERGIICLTGFMGTGKSTIGRALAQALGWPFRDTDAIVVDRAGMVVPRIFEVHGEAWFRRAEQGVFRELCALPRAVIATGGGTLLDDELRSFAEAHCMVVLLKAAPDTIASRIGSGVGRPLAPQWRELLEARQPSYARIRMQVDTTDLPVEIAVERIIALWHAASK
jgi:shikimate kinase